MNERANEQESGPVLTSEFLVVLDHSAAVAASGLEAAISNSSHSVTPSGRESKLGRAKMGKKPKERKELEREKTILYRNTKEHTEGRKRRGSKRTKIKR